MSETYFIAGIAVIFAVCFVTAIAWTIYAVPNLVNGGCGTMIINCDEKLSNHKIEIIGGPGMRSLATGLVDEPMPPPPIDSRPINLSASSRELVELWNELRLLGERVGTLETAFAEKEEGE